MEKPEAKGGTGLDMSTTLAIERTRLAYERTMMAWVRTSTSMITFGFTIYKFFQFEREQGVPRIKSLLGPRLYALMMIGIGLAALILSTVQHWQNLKHLPPGDGKNKLSISALLAGMVAILGILALIAVLLRQ